MAVKGNNLAPHEIESVLLKKFGETLTNGALSWYSLLPEHSIDSFDMLADSFIKAHAGSRKATTWVDVHNCYESKIRIEDDQLSFSTLTKDRNWEKNKEKSKDDFDSDRRFSNGRFFPYERAEGRGRGFHSVDRLATDRRYDHVRNNMSLQDKEISGSLDSSYPRLFEYNFNDSVVEMVSVMRNIKEAQFPKPMRSDTSQMDPNLWCEYLRTNGHRTGDCRHLREEVATLLKNGNLREFLCDRAKNNYGRNRDNAEPSKIGEDPLRLTINMVFGGNEINGITFLAVKKMKVSVTHSKRLREIAEDDITLTEEDIDGLLLLHNDALVISLNVLDFKIKRVLVDRGSSANVIQWRVL
ncbi:uncharacterized protein LOC142167966 [Nicotiana tabacum]|uniref:Uncharacterized protein LOC142167966 n=1 Tax=Nicotiana tabacum TaxID=4097 RepID=A0AC58SIB4_TOBAC